MPGIQERNLEREYFMQYCNGPFPQHGVRMLLMNGERILSFNDFAKCFLMHKNHLRYIHVA